MSPLGGEGEKLQRNAASARGVFSITNLMVFAGARGK